MPEKLDLRKRAERAREWLEPRVGLSDVEKLARKKDVPVHRHTIWYYLGGMTLFLFVIQVATGILLLFYYRPSADQAYESIRFLMAEVEFGWLVRSIHHWAANLMILTAFLHLFSVLFMKAYRRPRELTWVSGVVLLGISMAFGFTGYLLPWNELAFFATRVGTEIVGVIPLIGDFALRFLRGGEDVSGATLTRFYAFHVAVLPAITTGLLALHLFLVQKHGMSVPPSVEDEGGPERRMPFVPDFLMRDLVGWLTALALLAALAAYFPAHLGQEADPFAPAPAGIKPEWYFMFMFQSLKYLPAHILWIEGEIVGILFYLVAGILVVLVPFFDERRRDNGRGRLVTRVGIGAIVYILILTLLGYLANPTA